MWSLRVQNSLENDYFLVDDSGNYIYTIFENIMDDEKESYIMEITDKYSSSSSIRYPKAKIFSQITLDEDISIKDLQFYNEENIVLIYSSPKTSYL